jgi:hypothetical protein
LFYILSSWQQLICPLKSLAPYSTDSKILPAAKFAPIKHYGNKSIYFTACGLHYINEGVKDRPSKTSEFIQATTAIQVFKPSLGQTYQT